MNQDHIEIRPQPGPQEDFLLSLAMLWLKTSGDTRVQPNA